MFIGAETVVLPGVTIGSNVTIASGKTISGGYKRAEGATGSTVTGDRKLVLSGTQDRSGVVFQDFNVVEVTEEINTVYVTVITTPKSATQIAEKYGFTAQQKQMLTELLSSENAELWAGILSE